MPKKKRLLVMLPELPSADKFLKLLTPEYELLRAADEEEGLRILKQERKTISAILLDLDIAKKTDFAFFKTVSANVLYAAIPVVGTLPRQPAEEDLACLDVGAADVFTPTGSAKLLLRRLSNVIRSKDSATFYEIERMLRALPSNIYLKDAEGKYIFATHYWHHLDTKGDPNWTIRGKTDLEIRKDKENAVKAHESDKIILATGEGTRYTIKIDADNQLEYLELIKEPVRDDDGNITGIVGLINNVTEQQLLKLELERRSKTDELTGLFNRRYYREYFPTIYKPANFPIAFISMDCNGLKKINDTYGHLVGDEYIRMSALLLRMELPDHPGIFRVGGDEFFVVLPNTDETEAQQLIDNMKKKSSMFKIREQKLSIAFGISILRSEADDVKACVEAADQNMYENKNKEKQARK